MIKRIRSWIWAGGPALLIESVLQAGMFVAMVIVALCIVWGFFVLAWHVAGIPLR